MPTLTADQQDRKQLLEELVMPLDNADVECDGMAQLVATVLFRNGTQYQGMVGQITPDGFNHAIPHVWVEVGEFVIDLRQRMWRRNDPSVQHGVFLKSEYLAEYEGVEVHIEPLDDVMFSILSMAETPEIKALRQQLEEHNRSVLQRPREEGPSP
ncbi:hypothetical protein ACYPKM_01615 [Pseudomonas aeruginosa]